MKTVTGRVISAEPISLSKAATLLSGFASSDNHASQDVSAYLRRASAAFSELKSFHREIKSKETKPSSDARCERNVTGEFDGGKIRDRKGEAMSDDSVYGREQEDMKKKKKKNKNKYEDVIDEKVKEKLEDEERSVERKEKKKKKKRKSEEEMGSEERKSKKKRKSDEEMGSEERKSKKKRKSDEEMGSEEKRKGKKKRKSKGIDG